ncbi:hypothetical protein TELCIR_10267 [Teladorsagia circumcincta]|uniref:Uncharacterized protein n=1 Tax=Teladorsagia circumcincta TaxID=45464 RepID=A0A2G9UCK4_TELCI|nr:hypothetical protein TELCIR_10267 [Teladorsagia circumcincta]
MKRENERRLDVVCDEKEARMLEDEQLALLMQNKEFLRWIRHEQLPYISSSSRPAKVHRKRSSGKEHGPPVPEGPVVDELIINAEPDLKDRLKNVSKGETLIHTHLRSFN